MNAILGTIENGMFVTRDLGRVRTVAGFDADDANRVADGQGVKLDFRWVRDTSIVGGHFSNSAGDVVTVE